MDLAKHRQGVQIEYPGCFSQRDFATLGPLAVRVETFSYGRVRAACGEVTQPLILLVRRAPCIRMPLKRFRLSVVNC